LVGVTDDGFLGDVAAAAAFAGVLWEGDGGGRAGEKEEVEELHDGDVDVIKSYKGVC
jgi:hypothetical protein